MSPANAVATSSSTESSSTGSGSSWLVSPPEQPPAHAISTHVGHSDDLSIVPSTASQMPGGGTPCFHPLSTTAPQESGPDRPARQKTVGPPLARRPGAGASGRGRGTQRVTSRREPTPER